MKVVYYAAMSLDGFIADVDHGVEWLDRVDIKQEASDYESFFSKVDGLLMGRKTFDFVYNYGQWPYENRPTWVCSRRPVPAMPGCNIQIGQEPEVAIQAARKIGLNTLWVIGGGDLVASLIAINALTHITVSLMPVLLGDGIRFVGLLPDHLYLRQIDSSFLSGYTQIEYCVGV